MQDKARDAAPPFLVALRGHVVIGVLGQNIEDVAQRRAFEVERLVGLVVQNVVKVKLR